MVRKVSLACSHVFSKLWVIGRMMAGIFQFLFTRYHRALRIVPFCWHWIAEQGVIHAKEGSPDWLQKSVDNKS
ncbi:MAG: hypothetical protein H8E20_05050 [Verrucomicrobia bacterium]|nr:hypothetical protein [Verrucomicrobiota bacterium]